MRKPIGHKLYEHRRATGLSQREMAFLLGSQAGSRVSRYETGRRLPPTEILLAYLAIHQRTFTELFPDAYRQACESVLAKLIELVTSLPDVDAGTYKVEVLTALMGALQRTLALDNE